MSFPRALVEWLAKTPVSHAFNESNYLFFGGFMALHLLGIAFVLGTSLVLDLRVFNLGIVNLDFAKIRRVLQPWFITGLALALLAGTWLFVADPIKYYANPVFHVKIYCLLLAFSSQLLLINSKSSHLIKPLAAIALASWFGTIISGRIVGLL
ncbi:MAG: hypothetical protein QM581_02520 [Pseudomonas sp.]